MIRLSAGTASCIGLASGHMDRYPTTAYLLSGNHCKMNCSFCPQGNSGSEALNRLGRISWPEYSWADIEGHLARAEEYGFRRICLQSVRYEDGIDSLLRHVEKLKACTKLPLSLSAWIRNEKEATALVAAGVERISVSLDVVNPEAHKMIKGGSLQDRFDLLMQCAGSLAGCMSTHVICGLGESEAEALSIIEKLIRADVTVALFAFVPLRGTLLEKAKPPAVDSYRRVQAGYYLLRSQFADLSSFIFKDGRLISFGLPQDKLRQLLAGGEAFQTSGCPGCNRPYYNERPGGTIYNYHRPLQESEIKQAFQELLI